MDKGRVVCKVCNEVKVYSSTTTNMRTHLDRNHWQETHTTVSIVVNNLDGKIKVPDKLKNASFKYSIYKMFKML